MSKISDLARALNQKTIEKKIQWEIQDQSSIYTFIGKNSIFINENGNVDNRVMNLSIFDVKGVKVDEESFSPWSDTFTMMAEMMARARRDSLRADETLDEILTKVNGL